MFLERQLFAIEVCTLALFSIEHLIRYRIVNHPEDAPSVAHQCN